MKKFIINILIFFGIVAVIDVAAGKVFWYLQSTKAGGRTGAEYYACMESNEDVIIMGSSRASHHYVPQIITDSIGLSCFNAGQDGNGIIMQYGRWKMISERYTPKVLVYDVTPGFDLVENDNMTYIDHLKPFCSDWKVNDYVAGIFPLERYKLMSHMYRYNYKFLEILSDCARGRGDELKGYIPLEGQIRQEVVEGSFAQVAVEVRYDSEKLRYLECLANECQEKGTRLMFVVSPYYGGASYTKETFAPVSEIAERYGVPFMYFNDRQHSLNPKIFKDSHHLNDEGAQAFTIELVSQIRL